MPWLLSQARPRVRDSILGKFPPQLLAAYREQWGPAYAGLEIWPASGETGPETEAGPEAGQPAQPSAEPAAAGHDR
jgi:hypothetical protein